MSQNNESVTKEIFTSDCLIEAIEPSDNSVDIVGFIESVKKFPKKQDKKQKIEFILSNDSKKRIQGVVWEENFILFEKVLVEMNVVVEIKMAKAHEPKYTNFNKGNVPFELVLQDISHVRKIGIYKEFKESTVIHEYVDFKDISQSHGEISVSGYIKTNLNVLKTKGPEYLLGSLTDGMYKLDLRIYKFPKDWLDKINTEKGSFVTVLGTLLNGRNCPNYLSVKSIEDVKVDKLRKKMPLKELLQGFHYPL